MTTDAITKMEAEAAGLLEQAEKARAEAEAARRKAEQKDQARRDDWDRAELAATIPRRGRSASRTLGPRSRRRW